MKAYSMGNLCLLIKELALVIFPEYINDLIMFKTSGSR